MIADDYESIKKALEEILNEKEKEKATKGDRLIVDDPHVLRPGTGNSDVNSIWVWSTAIKQPHPDQQADGQQAPKQAAP